LYSIPGRMPNPLYAWHPVNRQAKNQESLTPIPLLMVSRIDAPTPELARQMVDSAILAEQVGLLGNAYIDARGLNAGDSSPYGYYDQGLRDTAKLFSDRTSYKTILENTNRLFSQRGKAPNVGLYVSWYRLRSYEDAFTLQHRGPWVPYSLRGGHQSP